MYNTPNNIINTIFIFSRRISDSKYFWFVCLSAFPTFLFPNISLAIYTDTILSSDSLDIFLLITCRISPPSSISLEYFWTNSLISKYIPNSYPSINVDFLSFLVLWVFSYNVVIVFYLSYLVVLFPTLCHDPYLDKFSFYVCSLIPKDCY